MRLLACLLTLVSAAAAAQPYAVTEPLGPVEAVVRGNTTALVPLSAAAEGDGFVVLTMVPAEHPVVPLRATLVALRLDAAGAVTTARHLPSLGAVQIILDPRVSGRLRPDGHGFLFGAVFGNTIRAVRLDATLTPTVVAERPFAAGINITLRDVVRLTDEVVLFAGDNLRSDGSRLRTEPLALLVGRDGGERALVAVPTWNEAVTDAAVLPGAVVLAGWSDEGGDRAFVVRTFDADVQPTGAQRLSTEGYPRDARLVGLDDGRAVLAVASPDSAGRGRHRMVAAVGGVPGGAVVGSAFAGTRAHDAYLVDDVWGLGPFGTVLVGRSTVPARGRRVVLARPEEGGAAAWTLPVGTPGTVRSLAVGPGDGSAPVMLSAHAAVAHSASRAGVWHLERTTFTAQRPAAPWLAPPAAPTDAVAFDGYARAVLGAPAADDRGAALRAYAQALDATADSAAASHALQQQATALLDHDFRSGADALLAAGSRVLLRTRPAMPIERKRCIATLFLWSLEAARARGNAAAVPVPERPVVACER